MFPACVLRLVPLALGILLIASSAASAQGLSTTTPVGRALAAPVLDPFTGIVSSCRLDVRLFRSLRSGTLDYCRGHLTYEPGALDCFQFVDQVCTVLLPVAPGITETRRDGAPLVFPCPDGPQPPVCPRFVLR